MLTVRLLVKRPIAGELMLDMLMCNYLIAKIFGEESVA